MCLGLRLPDRTRCNRGGRILREGDVDTRTCPGQSTGVEFVLAFDTSVDIACRTAVHAARSFAARWDATADAWRTLWRSAFTPGNTEFSGYLPTLSTEDSDVARTYYLGAL